MSLQYFTDATRLVWIVMFIPVFVYGLLSSVRTWRYISAVQRHEPMALYKHYDGPTLPFVGEQIRALYFIIREKYLYLGDENLKVKGDIARREIINRTMLMAAFLVFGIFNVIFGVFGI